MPMAPQVLEIQYHSPLIEWEWWLIRMGSICHVHDMHDMGSMQGVSCMQLMGRECRVGNRMMLVFMKNLLHLVLMVC